MRIETNRAWTVAELLVAVDGADPATVLVFGKTLKADVKGECWCGCGGSTRKKFVPGHDSRFHSLAKQVARGQASRPASFVCDAAEADFDKWHDAEVPVHAARVTAKAVTDAAKAKIKADKPVVTVGPLVMVKSIVKIDRDSAEHKAPVARVAASSK